MKLNWQTKKLGEVCNIVNGSTPLRSNKEFWHNGDVAWFTIDDIREQGRVIKSTKQKITKKALGKISNRLLPPESVLLCCTASVGEYAITKIPLTTNQQFNGLIVKDKKFLDPSFLFYFSSTLKERLLGLSGKTTIDFIPISRLKDIEILIPSLEEQKRIVKIIEGVFYKVVKAQENAEKNLKNSKDLFEAYLQSIFSNPGEDWEVVDFEECIDKVVYTNKVQRKEFLESGKFPIVSQEKDLINGYWDKDEDLFHVKTPCTIFGDHTQILKYIDFDFVLGADGVKILQPKDILYPKFFFYFLNSLTLKSLGYARHYRLLKEKQVSFPKSIVEQKVIVKKLETLSAETKKLEVIYQKKLENLEEMKKSILQKAFSGAL